MNSLIQSAGIAITAGVTVAMIMPMAPKIGSPSPVPTQAMVDGDAVVAMPSGDKIVERRPPEPETKALPKGDLLVSRSPGENSQGAGHPGALAHIKINGGEEFVLAVRRTIADFEARGSAQLLKVVGRIQSINELSQDGGRVLAFIRDGGCMVRMYPRGWRSSPDARASVIAHEAWHCELYAEGRYAENRDHGPSFSRIEQQAALELYGGGGIPGRRTGQYARGPRPCDQQENGW